METSPQAVLEVPVPPVEPKIEAFESLIRAQEEEAMRRRGLPISLLRRGDKDIARHLREMELASAKREAALSQEIQSLRQRISALEAERSSLLADITRLTAEKAGIEEAMGSELRLLRAQLFREHDEATSLIDSLRAELEGTLTTLLNPSINRRKQLESAFEDKELELLSLRRDAATFAEKESKWKETEVQVRILAEKHEELLRELTELKVLRKNVRELLAERENFNDERRQWTLKTEEEVASVRRSVESEVAALRLTYAEDTHRIAAQAEQEKAQLRTAMSVIEKQVHDAEAGRHEAEQRVAQLSVQLGESAKKIVAERASTVAQQTQNLAMVEQLRRELDDFRRLRQKDSESWAEEKKLLAAKLRFVEENLLQLELSAGKITAENSALRSTISTARREWAEERIAAHALAVQRADEISSLCAELNSRTAVHADEYASLQQKLADLECEKQFWLSKAEESEKLRKAEIEQLQRNCIEMNSELETSMLLFTELRVQHADRIERLEAAQREAVLNLAVEREIFAAEISAKERELITLKAALSTSASRQKDTHLDSAARIEQLASEKQALQLEHASHIADRERVIISLREELQAITAHHTEGAIRLSEAVKRHEAEKQDVQQLRDEESKRLSAEIGDRDREILSLRSELNTTLSLHAEQRSQLSQRIQELEDELLSLKSQLEAASATTQDRSTADEIARLSGLLNVESRARKHAEEEHLRVCALYADALASVQQANHQADSQHAEHAAAIAGLDALRAEHQALQSECEQNGKIVVTKEHELSEVYRQLERQKEALELTETEVRRLGELKSNSAVELVVLKGEVDYFAAKLKEQTAAAETAQRERAALQVRFDAAESALIASSEKLQAERHLTVLKDTQVAALQQSREDLVNRLQKEKTRAAAESERAESAVAELQRVSEERARMSALVERLIAQTASSSTAISEAQAHLRAFNLAAVEAMITAARHSLQIPSSALDANLLLRQLELKSEQHRLERLARKDAECDAALLRLQMEQLRTKEEESAAKFALERLESRRLAQELATIQAQRASAIAAREASQKRATDAESELHRVRADMQSQQAEMTPLRERLAYVSQKAAHLSEQAAAYDAQLHQSTELLVAATTPLKTRASSRLSLASSLASPLAESLPSVAEELSKEASEVEEETAQIIHTNPLVQSRRRLMRTSENSARAPASPLHRRASSSAATSAQAKPLSPANSVPSSPRADEKPAAKDVAAEKKEHKASIAELSSSSPRQVRTPVGKAIGKSLKPRGTSSFSAVPRAPFGKQ